MLPRCHTRKRIGGFVRVFFTLKYDRKKFFDGVKDRIDPTLNQDQVNGLEFLIAAFENEPLWKDVRHVAYALATVFHETAGSFQPVVEGYYLAKTDPPDYSGKTKRVKDFHKTLRYFPYFGRGYIQLTHKANYEKAGKAFGVDLVNNPSLALTPDIAFKCLGGMFKGWYGGKLGTYINDKKTDYINARRCVNVLDKAGLIAGYAQSFAKILKNSAAASTAEESIGPSAGESGQTNPTGSEPPNSSEPPPTNQPTIAEQAMAGSENAEPPVPVQTVAAEITHGSQPTGIKGMIMAGVGIITSIGSGFFSLFQGLGPVITISFFASAVLIASVWLYLRYREKENNAKRKAEADEKDKQRAFELQMVLAEAARRKDMNTIAIIPPPVTTGPEVVLEPNKEAK